MVDTVPDIRDYQQLDEPKTGPYDCTAYTGAVLLHAHTKGVTTTTGRTVRLRSDEPIPDPDSPGLNYPQIDASIRKIAPAVDLDTRSGYQALTRGQIKNRAVDGRWFGIQVLRGVLVHRGFGGNSDFMGGHSISVHTREIDNEPVILDSLVPWAIRTGWDALFDAGEACPGAGGRINTIWTRDLTPDYHVVIRPPKGYDEQGFARFIVRYNPSKKRSEIVDSRPEATPGFEGDCAPPRYFANKAGGKGRLLVKITEGQFKGWYVDDRWAREKNP